MFIQTGNTEEEDAHAHARTHGIRGRTDRLLTYTHIYISVYLYMQLIT